MAAPTHPHVLLETVARGACSGAQLTEARDLEEGSDSDGDHSQELLALVAVAGDTSGNDERLACGTGFGEYPRALDEGARLRLRIVVCFALMNRPVRTRMPGGVGGAG